MPLVKLTKMGPEEDPGHWAVILALYLMGMAQTAYQGIDPAEAQDYSKAAILSALAITPETHCQRLCQRKFAAGNCPWAVVHWMKEHCWRWLFPEDWTGEQVAEQVTLEQYTKILPTWA